MHEVEQPEIWFFDPSTSGPSEEVKAAWCDPDSPDSPFAKFIGNKSAVRRLNRAAYSAFGRHNRECSEQSFALLGPASTGKTMLSRLYAELLCLPFVEIDASAVNDLQDIAIAISKVLENTPIHGSAYPTLELQDLGNNEFSVPPCIVLIDEVHNLPKKVEQGLLKATEKKDSKLVVLTNDGSVWTMDTKSVCWMIATTDRGNLFDAFDTRFSKIHLKPYTLAEIAQIIQLNNPDWDMETCQLVAKFGGHVPREALDFAHQVRQDADMNEDDWGNIVARVAEDNDIDPYGMTYQRLAVLSALGQGPVAKGNLGGVANCKEAELVKFVMPPLLASTADQLPLVKVTSRGYCLTAEGVKELDKRHIPYDPDLFAKGVPLSARLGRNNHN